jgi:hypothetical protein
LVTTRWRAFNAHDFLYCGIITKGFAKHYPAGADVQAFIDLGDFFGIPQHVTADYATLGACAFFLIAAELIMAFASLRRLVKLSARKVNETVTSS